MVSQKKDLQPKWVFPVLIVVLVVLVILFLQNQNNAGLAISSSVGAGQGNISGTLQVNTDAQGNTTYTLIEDGTGEVYTIITLNSSYFAWWQLENLLKNAQGVHLDLRKVLRNDTTKRIAIQSRTEKDVR